MPRRRAGVLLPLELSILETGLEMQTRQQGFHGFALASTLRGGSESAALLGHGTLYKALSRMATAGLLSSEWEDPAIAESAGRPRRKLYRVTGEGASALAAARSAEGPSTGAAARPASDPA